MTQGQKIGYARVSSESQNIARQLAELDRMGVERVFSDTVSGKNTKRPGFEAMMRYLREGDTLVVCSMDRLSRSLKDLIDVTKELRERKVAVHFLKEGLNLDPGESASPMTNFIFSMFGAVAEFERELIKERQREGIALAKAKGVYRGRKPTDEKILSEAKRRVDLGVPLSKVAKDLKVGRTTLYKYLRTLKRQDQAC